MVTVIKNEKQEVMFDEFDDATILFTELVGYHEYSKNEKDPREMVHLLSKLFSRFDMICEENRVYKVHTFGDSYVIMGYNGKIDKTLRKGGVIVDEANRVVTTALEMINIFREIKESAEDKYDGLELKVGINTGKIIAGIIGSKVVRYDIFGEGVLITKKMVKHGVSGRICISEETKKYLQLYPNIAAEYDFEYLKTVYVANIDKHVKQFTIDQKVHESIDSALLDSNTMNSLEINS